MRKRIYSILLAAIMLVTLIPITVLAEDPHVCNSIVFDKEIANAADLAELFTNGGSGYLTADITTNSDASRLIKAGKTINLCLNGFVLTLGNNNGQNIGIEGNGVLNLYDCGTKTHKFSVGTNGLWTLDETSGTETVTGGIITGGKGGGGIAGAVYMASGAQFNMYGGNIIGNQASGNCGAVYAAGTSVFNMSGGTIAGNIASGLSGAIHIEAGAVFNLSGGTIDSNKSNSWGGAVCSYGTFNMTGGAITNNTSTQGGGGISISDNSTFSMSGGEISGCISGNEGGGACIGRDGVNLSIGGTAVITGNKRNSTTENLYLRTGGTSRLGVNTPAEGMSVGITMQTPGQFTNTTATSSDEQYFTSDNNNYRVKYKPDGFLQLESTTIADVLATNTDFPTSNSWDAVPESAWESENGATAHLATNALHLLYQGKGMSTDVTATVTFENGNYVYTYGSTIITFNMTDDVLESITVSGMSEKLDGTYKPVTYYTVTFDTDGGSKVDAQEIADGKLVTEPTKPAKDGYTFVAWVDANGKTFDFNTPITADVTIKATWEKNPVPTPEPEPINYRITQGANSVWVIAAGESPTFRSNAPFEKFSHVLLDGHKLHSSAYKGQSGSTLITLTPEFTATLAPGKHTIEIVSTDGSASTVFYIDNDEIAQTDGSLFKEATMSSGFVGFAIVGLSAIFFELKKKKVK